MSIIYAQRDKQWNTIPLGWGTETIGSVGCAVSSLAMALKDLGYDYNPATLNQAIKDVGGYVAIIGNKSYPGTPQNGGNLLAWACLERILPGKVKFVGTESYSSTPAPLDKLKDYLDSGHSVLLEMSSIPIGGRAYHYVKALQVDSNNVIIQDPWYSEIAPITKRFSYGGTNFDTAAEIITGFRVYKIEPNLQGGNMADTISVNKKDYESIVAKATKFDAQNPLYDQLKQHDTTVAKERDDARTDADNKGKKIDEQAKVIEGLDKDLKASKTVADEREKKYNDLITYLADKLQVTQDEAIIKGEIEKLLALEDQLSQGDKTLEKMKEEYKQQIDTLTTEVNDLRTQFTKYLADLGTFTQKYIELEDKVSKVANTEKQINYFDKLIEGIKKLFNK